MCRKVPDMPSSTPLSPDACARMTRRGVLTLPALAGAGVVLAGCGVLKKGGSASGKGLGTASPRAAVATATGPHGGVMLEAGWKGVPLSVEVGPAVIKDKYTIIRLGIVVSSNLSCTGWGGLCFRVGFFVGILGVGWSFRGTKAAVGSGG